LQLQEQHAAEKIGGQVVLKWPQSGQYHFAQKTQRHMRTACCPTGQSKNGRGKMEKDAGWEKTDQFFNAVQVVLRQLAAPLNGATAGACLATRCVRQTY
jgi:hypothetical protein